MFSELAPLQLGQTFETLARVVGRCCERLQRKNVPFNLLIADHGARVFLIPQVFSHRVAKGEIPEDVVATGVNPAVFEISGHLLYKQEGDYDNVTEEDACRLLECASLSEEEFLETVAYMLADEAVSEDDSSSSSLLTPPTSGVVTNATPVSPAAVAAAAAVAGKAQAAKVAAAAAVAVESHAFVDSDSDDATAKSEDGVVPSNSP